MNAACSKALFSSRYWAGSRHRVAFRPRGLHASVMRKHVMGGVSCAQSILCIWTGIAFSPLPGETRRDGALIRSYAA